MILISWVFSRLIVIMKVAKIMEKITANKNFAFFVSKAKPAIRIKLKLKYSHHSDGESDNAVWTGLKPKTNIDHQATSGFWGINFLIK